MIAWVVLLLQAGGYDEQLFEYDYLDAVAVEELNGDGRPDLIVQSGVELLIYLGTRSGFPAEPDRRVRLREDAFIWTLASLDGRPEVLAMGSRGIHRARDDAPLVVAPTLFEGHCSAEFPPFRYDFAPDVSGNGTPELLHFGREGTGLFRRTEGRYRLWRRFELSPRTSTESGFGARKAARIRTSIPYLQWRDIDGDRGDDLIVFDGSTARFYLQPFDAEPTEVKFPSGGRTNGRFRLAVPPVFGDLSGDGVLDIVTTEASKGRVRIYYGRAGRVDYSVADAERRIEDAWSGGTKITDVNGDGRPELVLWTIPRLGVVSGLSAFSSKRVDVQVSLFRTEAGVVAKRAARTIDLSIPFDVSISHNDIRFGFVFEPSLEGDYDGDGAKDVVLMEGDELVFYRGRRDARLVESEEGGRLKVRRPSATTRTRLLARDLNGDGRDDLLLRHHDPGQERAVLEIRTSR